MLKILSKYNVMSMFKFYNLNKNKNYINMKKMIVQIVRGCSSRYYTNIIESKHFFVSSFLLLYYKEHIHEINGLKKTKTIQSKEI
jgi:hypothetical protein